MTHVYISYILLFILICYIIKNAIWGFIYDYKYNNTFIGDVIYIENKNITPFDYPRVKGFKYVILDKKDGYVKFSKTSILEDDTEDTSYSIYSCDWESFCVEWLNMRRHD